MFFNIVVGVFRWDCSRGFFGVGDVDVDFDVFGVGIGSRLRLRMRSGPRGPGDANLR